MIFENRKGLRTCTGLALSPFTPYEKRARTKWRLKKKKTAPPTRTVDAVHHRKSHFFFWTIVPVGRLPALAVVSSIWERKNLAPRLMKISRVGISALYHKYLVKSMTCESLKNNVEMGSCSHTKEPTMAKKLVDGFGHTPQVQTNLSPITIARLSKEEWFVEYHNIETRNAIASALNLVDHDGDKIFYNGKEKDGFKIPFEKVLFLRNNKHGGVFKYTPYHKESRNVPWKEWREGRKPPSERLRNNSHLFSKS